MEGPHCGRRTKLCPHWDWLVVWTRGRVLCEFCEYQYSSVRQSSGALLTLSFVLFGNISLLRGEPLIKSNNLWFLSLLRREHALAHARRPCFRNSAIRLLWWCFVRKLVPKDFWRVFHLLEGIKRHYLFSLSRQINEVFLFPGLVSWHFSAPGNINYDTREI
jgi:hypothetical protein